MAEAFQVLARRYRPQTFEEVRGQDAIVRALTNALRSDRIAHAFLFHGTRGVGKTTMARLLAKALNCEQGPTAEPCNACAPCREIAAGSAVDVLEIDGASHNRVDDVRELQESLTYQPVRDRYRVVIIDEVHMLSRSAFNALLKTLEEPPAHVVFVLATTELEKIPATILSRCQHYTFRRLNRRDLIHQLKGVAERESFELSDASLSLLARQAGGSLRDALSALDQIVSFCGPKVADDEVEAVLGALPAHRVDALLSCVAQGDAGGALAALAASEDRGDDPVRFVEALLARLRDLAVLAAAGDRGAELVDAGEEELEELRLLAGRFGDDGLLRLFQMATQVEPALRHSRHPRALLELLALKMVKAADLTPLAELAERLAGGGNAGGGAGPAGTAGGGAGGGRRATLFDAGGQTAAPPATGPPPVAGPPRSVRQGTDGHGNLDLGPLRAAVEQLRPAVAAFLEHAEGTFTAGELRLDFQPRHSFFKKSVEMPANFEALQKAVRRVVGDVPIRLGLAQQERAEPAPPARESEDERRQRLLVQAREQPAVRSLGEIFGAEIVNIQPLDPADEPRPENET